MKVCYIRHLLYPKHPGCRLHLCRLYLSQQRPLMIQECRLFPAGQMLILIPL